MDDSERFARVVEQIRAASQTRRPNYALRWLSFAAVIALGAVLFGCKTTPEQVADSKPRIPRDLRFICHPSGDWAVVSESAREAVIHSGAAPCERGAI